MLWEILSLALSFALITLLAILAFALEPLVLALWFALGRLTYNLRRCTRTLLRICCELAHYTPIHKNTQIAFSPQFNIKHRRISHKKLRLLEKTASHA